MPAATARALSMGLVGGALAILFYTQGLLPWAAFIGWASFLHAGEDTAALKKSILGNTIGAVIGWVVLVSIMLVIVEEGSWLWMPRTGLMLVVALLILGLLARGGGTERLTSALCGFGAVFGAASAAVPVWVTGTPLTALRLHNPVVATIISMAGGAIAGLIALRLAGAMSRE